MLNKKEIEIIKSVVAVASYTEIEKVELIADKEIQLTIDGIKEDTYTNKVDFINYLNEGLSIGNTEIEKEFINVLEFIKTGNKKDITNNEYNRISKLLANKFYKNYKVYSDMLETYNILPFKINTTNDLLSKVINFYCRTEEQRQYKTLYRGLTNSENTIYKLKNDLNLNTIYDGGYNVCLYSDNLKLIVEYTEGDLNFSISDTIDLYEKEKLKTIEFYNNNY